MSDTSPFQNARNPLRRLPSVLAVPTLRSRLVRADRARPTREDELVKMLELDPLSAARALRAASPSVFGAQRSLLSARDIIQRLGEELGARLFDDDPRDIDGEGELLALWLHAIATGHAARAFAAQTGHADPDAVYMAGLLQDLPSWIERIEGSPRAERPTDWVVHWQLPAPFMALILDGTTAEQAERADEIVDAKTLIQAAKITAEFAGFAHPDSDVDALHQTIGAWSSEQMQVADNLRQMVESVLEGAGVHPAHDGLSTPSRDNDTSTENEQLRGPESLVLSILSSASPQTYREAVTTLTVAARDGGRFDRVFFAKWNAETATIMLRKKHDSSHRRMAETRIQVSPPERDRLELALQTQTPAVFGAEPNGDYTLLRGLSTDELLAVPLNHEFDKPSFLLLDRSLTLTPIGDEQELHAAKALGMTGSLLVQNLLLRRRRQRAQKFALTDPLTHLFNRRMGILSLEQAVARTERDRSPLTVLMCDLDHFKDLNDKHGHLQGDAALRTAADVLRSTVRANDTVCRYGGEEFLIVLPDTTPDEATVLATRMFTAVQARGEALGLPLTISIGLTCYRFGDTVESMLHRSDRALYASKDYGRNRFSADVEVDDADPKRDEPPSPSGAA